MRNTLLQSIQQPLPPASLSHGQPGTAGPASAAVTTAEQLLGATKPPPPPLTLPPPSPGGQSKHHPPTPLSADMEDAESQISQLLESLQKQQGSAVKAEPDKMSEFFDSLAGSKSAGQPMPQAIGRIRSQSGSISMSPEPPVITTTSKTSETFAKPPRFFNENVGSPSMPV